MADACLAPYADMISIVVITTASVVVTTKVPHYEASSGQECTGVLLADTGCASPPVSLVKDTI